MRKYGLFIFLLLFACSRDNSDGVQTDCSAPVSYVDVVEIIQNTCAYAGCHDGSNDNSDFSNRELLINDLNTNGVEGFSNLILSEEMPPSYTENGPTSLSQEDIQLLQCWYEQDFPE